MPAADWTEAPSNLQPIPPSCYPFLIGIPAALATAIELFERPLTLDLSGAELARELSSSGVAHILAALASEMEGFSRDLSRAQSFVAQQDCEVIRTDLSDLASDLDRYCAALYQSEAPASSLEDLSHRLTDIFAAAQQVIEEDEGAASYFQSPASAPSELVVSPALRERALASASAALSEARSALFTPDEFPAPVTCSACDAIFTSKTDFVQHAASDAEHLSAVLETLFPHLPAPKAVEE